MNNKFFEKYFETRNDTLKDITSNSNEWNKFINYWARILDNYSVDNIINLYSYNPYGNVFMTFDEWNSDKIDRRIKPKSKGIPIMVDNHKIYVFDIKQTYGKDYKIWKYNHFMDNLILDYYQSQIKVKYNNEKSLFQNYYDTFYEISLKQIMDNYKDLSVDEVEFVTKTMTSLFLSKIKL